MDDIYIDNIYEIDISNNFDKNIFKDDLDHRPIQCINIYEYCKKYEYILNYIIKYIVRIDTIKYINLECDDYTDFDYIFILYEQYKILRNYKTIVTIKKYKECYNNNSCSHIINNVFNNYVDWNKNYHIDYNLLYESYKLSNNFKIDGIVHKNKYINCDKIKNIIKFNNIKYLCIDNDFINIDMDKNHCFKKLEILHLTLNNKDLTYFIESCNRINYLINLKELNISYDGQILNLNFLNNLNNLEKLNIFRFIKNIDVIDDLSPLCNSKNLKYLKLYNIELNDISILSGLTNLEKLTLNHCNINYINGLAYLKKLKYLSLQNNNLEDISEIQYLNNLKKINLSDNNIHNIYPLYDLTKLKYISLSHNNISDIMPLEYMNNLEILYLLDNPINDIGILDDLEKLNKVYINNFDYIRDQSQIENSKKLGIKNYNKIKNGFDNKDNKFKNKLFINYIDNLIF